MYRQKWRPVGESARIRRRRSRRGSGSPSSTARCRPTRGPRSGGPLPRSACLSPGVGLFVNREGGYLLPPEGRPPALDERDPDGTEPGEGVDRVEAVLDALGQLRGELRVTEDLQVAAGRHLGADCLLFRGDTLPGRRWPRATRVVGCSWATGRRSGGG